MGWSGLVFLLVLLQWHCKERIEDLVERMRG